MDILDLNDMDMTDLAWLMEPGENWRLSLILPIQREPDKRRENLIRLKNLVRRAETQLENAGLESRGIAHLLKPAEEITKDPEFPTRQGEGLAIYMEDGEATAYLLPWAPAEERAIIAHHFYIRPLLPGISEPSFLILELSQDGIRLLQASEHYVRRMPLPEDVPQTMAEGLQWDDPEKQLQWHTGTGAETAGGRAAIYHGHGGAADESNKDDILRYFQLVDGALNQFLADESTPMVLVGVDYLLPLYEQANSYNYLLDEGVTGNYQHLSDEALLELAWPIMASRLQQIKDNALEKYGSLAAHDLATDDLPSVLTSAYQGRVDTLFVDPEAERWGEFGGTEASVVVRETPITGDEELLNLAVSYTLQNGGSVYQSTADQMPNHRPLVATLRF